MKKLLVLILILIASTSFAAQKAITDTGDEVILNDDGTWVYADKTKNAAPEGSGEIPNFNKPVESTFLLKSTINDSAYWINAQKWSFNKEKDDEKTEYHFTLKGADLYGMVINEEVEIEVNSLAEIAIGTAKEAAPDLQVVTKEHRIVNGNNVVFVEMSGTLQGMKITYLAYYHSDPKGSTQFLAYTGSSLVEKYRSEIEDFLNGFDVQ